MDTFWYLLKESLYSQLVGSKAEVWMRVFQPVLTSSPVLLELEMHPSSTEIGNYYQMAFDVEVVVRGPPYTSFWTWSVQEGTADQHQD